jgi:hypothetical protein
MCKTAWICLTALPTAWIICELTGGLLKQDEVDSSGSGVSMVINIRGTMHTARAKT